MNVMQVPVREADALAILSQAWAEVLPDVPLDPDMRWIDAGADSLKSLHLMMRLEEGLGRKLSYDLLDRETTVRELVRRLAGGDGAADGAGDAALPLVHLVPGVYGDEVILADFRRSLAGRVRFELVELPDVDRPMALLRDMAATGRDVAERIAARAGGAPLLIAGFSYGGLVAHEAARHLSDTGYEVALLCLLDSWPDSVRTQAAPAEAVDARARTWNGANRGRWIRRGGLRPDETPAAYGVRVAFNALIAAGAWRSAQRLLAVTGRLTTAEQRIGRRKMLLGLARRDAMERWTMRPLDLPCLLVATDDGAALGIVDRWRASCPRLRVAHVPGRHNDMFRGESLEQLDAALMDAIADAVGSARG